LLVQNDHFVISLDYSLVIPCGNTCHYLRTDASSEEMIFGLSCDRLNRSRRPLTPSMTPVRLIYSVHLRQRHENVVIRERLGGSGTASIFQNHDLRAFALGIVLASRTTLHLLQKVSGAWNFFQELRTASWHLGSLLTHLGRFVLFHSSLHAVLIGHFE
jgi:hypothetical protein